MYFLSCEEIKTFIIIIIIIIISVVHVSPVTLHVSIQFTEAFR